MRPVVTILGVLCTVAGAGVATEEGPVPVSPGGQARISVVPDRCPTFHWTAVQGAESVELAVYRVRQEETDGGPPEKAVAITLPGRANGWTPSLDLCFERGSRYAWTVRAISTKRSSEWAPPSLFEVTSKPSEAEFEVALEVIRRYLGPDLAANEVERGQASSEGRTEVGEPRDELMPTASATAFEILGSSAAIMVVGEVRTVDSGGEPRLWGRGRPDGILDGPFGGACNNAGIRYGLTRTAVGWGSAAEVCPAGSWVCRLADVVACNTGRPDNTRDGLACDGTDLDFLSNQHRGWIASGDEKTQGDFFTEDGFRGDTFTC